MDLADRGIQRRATSVLGGDRKVKSSLTRASSSFIIFLDARSWTPWAWDGERVPARVSGATRRL